MKRCGDCGHENWERPDLKADWSCDKCGHILEKYKRSGDHGGGASMRSTLTPPSRVVYDDSEYF